MAGARPHARRTLLASALRRHPRPGSTRTKGTTMNAHRMLGVCAVIALGTATAPAATAPYPDKPIRFVVPFPAGGATDLMARSLATKLAEQMGQAVVLDNRGGAGGTIGVETVAKAAPDGYTLLFGTMGALSINPSLYSKLPYNTLQDFTPVSVTHTTPRILVVHPSIAAKSVAELITLAKAKPGAFTFGSSGNGTSSHLTGELFRSSAGINIMHIPYKGTAPAAVDLIAGRISMTFDAPAIYVPHVRSNKLRALGVTSLKRLAMAPDVPTIAESGLPGFEVSNWLGVLAPARTSREIVAKLNGEIVKAMADPEMKKLLNGQGIEPASSKPEEFVSLIKSEMAKWAKVVKSSGARID
jgi:tripartite-type tricarboxylate transporter receptor subunit TctC